MFKDIDRNKVFEDIIKLGKHYEISNVTCDNLIDCIVISKNDNSFLISCFVNQHTKITINYKDVRYITNDTISLSNIHPEIDIKLICDELKKVCDYDKLDEQEKVRFCASVLNMAAVDETDNLLLYTISKIMSEK